MTRTNVQTRDENLLGKRVTVSLSPETYAGLLLLKLKDGQPIYGLVQDACALLIASREKEDVS